MSWEADIEPFEGPSAWVLLHLRRDGGADLGLAHVHPGLLAAAAGALLLAKIIVCFVLALIFAARAVADAVRLQPGSAAGQRVQLRAVLARRSRVGALDASAAAMATLVAAASMAATPVLFAVVGAVRNPGAEG